MILIVTYDLHGPRRNYVAVKKLLNTVLNTHPEGSVWFIDTVRTPDDWARALRNVGDRDDEFFVARISSDWQAFNQDKEASNWLNSLSRRW